MYSTLYNLQTKKPTPTTMKKILLSVSALFIAFTTYAQENESDGLGFKKGDTYISGNISYGSDKDHVTKTTNFTVSPTIGHFVSDNIAVGVTLSYMGQNNNTTGNPETKQKSFSGGVFGRYYFTPANRFSFFGELNANYNHSYSNTKGFPEYKGNGFSIQAGPGINYFLSPHFSLQSYTGLLSYGSSTRDTALGEVKETAVTARLNFSNILFGLTYKF